ncbi:MAG: hypothetical protein ABEN55_15240 [Bradymonadaceae bacterium]
MKHLSTRCATLLVGLGLIAFGVIGCETQEAQTEEEEEEVAEQRQDRKREEAEREDEQMRDREEQAQREEEAGPQPEREQEQARREPEAAEKQEEARPEEQLEVLGQTREQAQMGKLEGQTVARDLMLTSAKIAELDLADSKPEYVHYCFRGAVQNVDDDQGFYVQGYDSKVRTRGQTVSISEEDNSCVRVGFAPGTNLEGYTVAVVGPQTVSNEADETNIIDSAKIGEKRVMGRTSAPELTDVLVDPKNNRASFVFDQPIETMRAEQARRGGASGTTAGSGRHTGQAPEEEHGAGSGEKHGEKHEEKHDPNHFGFYTSSGEMVTADSIISAKQNRVEVKFKQAGMDGEQEGDAAGEEQAEEGPGLEEAARWFAQQGAVTDRQGEKSVLSGMGEMTDVPDLASVRQQNGSQWIYEFDEKVQNANAENFALYTDGGQMVEGNAASIGENDQQAQVTFPRAQDFDEAITRAAVAHQAVEAKGKESMSNTIGGSPIEDVAQGLSSGPDLVDTKVDESGSQINFVFDETLTQQVGGQPGGGGEGQKQDEGSRQFYIITEAGKLEPARQVVTAEGGEVTGDTMVVMFEEEAVKSAESVAVTTGAVRDQVGNPNPPYAMGIGQTEGGEPEAEGEESARR